MTINSMDDVGASQMPEKKPINDLRLEIVSESPESAPTEASPITNHLQGWSLHLLTISLMFAVFLPQVEGTIAATALVSITNDLDGFDKSSWIITAYMLTYTGILIISAKLSDIFGRKLLLISSITFFVILSGACAGAQSMTQLITLRAFQGIGASGTYSLVTVIFYELVLPEKYAPYTSVLSGVLGLSVVIGPVLGGVISNFTTWRWIFLFNVILGAVTIALLLLTLPNNYPHHHLPESVYKTKTIRENFSRQQFGRVDFLGTALLLCASILLDVALQETGLDYRWSSGFIIAVLTISILSWILFLAWSWRITSQNSPREPVFPWRFMQSRTCIGLLINLFLTGITLTVSIVQVPLRYQVANNLSPLSASVRLLPFIAFTTLGSVFTAGIAGKYKIPPLYLYMAASCLQVAAFALLSISPTDGHISHAQYAYEAMAGVAVGSNLAVLMIMAPFMVEERDRSVAMGSVLQFRTMGGAIGLAVVTMALNRYGESHLEGILTSDQVRELLKSTKGLALLSPETIEAVRTTFARGFNLQMRILIGTSAAQVPFSFMFWQKEQIRV